MGILLDLKLTLRDHLGIFSKAEKFRLQISFLILSEFKWINWLLFHLKSSENLWFADDFRGNISQKWVTQATFVILICIYTCTVSVSIFLSFSLYCIYFLCFYRFLLSFSNSFLIVSISNRLLPVQWEVGLCHLFLHLVCFYIYLHKKYKHFHPTFKLCYLSTLTMKLWNDFLNKFV